MAMAACFKAMKKTQRLKRCKKEVLDPLYPNQRHVGFVLKNLCN
jgi:hypothetical protein